MVAIAAIAMVGGAVLVGPPQVEADTGGLGGGMTVSEPVAAGPVLVAAPAPERPQVADRRLDHRTGTVLVAAAAVSALVICAGGWFRLGRTTHKRSSHAAAVGSLAWSRRGPPQGLTQV